MSDIMPPELVSGADLEEQSDLTQRIGRDTYPKAPARKRDMSNVCGFCATAQLIWNSVNGRYVARNTGR